MCIWVCDPKERELKRMVRKFRGKKYLYLYLYPSIYLYIIRNYSNDKEKGYKSKGTNIAETQVHILKGHILNIEGGE